MKTLPLLLLLLLQASDPTVEAILKEGRDNSRVMEHLDHLSNKIGPRLTSSTRLTQACEWTRAEFEKMGLKARLEEWGTFPVGFDRGPWLAKMVSPEAMDLTIGTSAWMPGTQGPVTGPAFLAPATDEELQALKPKLKGAWVLATGRDFAKYQVAYEDAGAAGILRGLGSDLIHTSGNPRIEWDKLPRRVVANMGSTQFKKITELIKGGKEVTLTIDIKNEFKQGPIKLFNVIAELPGTEKPDEYVIVGGHIDTWDGATGTTDNGTGVSTTLEAARLLVKSGAKPRRTIRFMLWSGEEQGLLGSRAYIKAHPEESAKISAVLVHDGGTNYVSGLNATEPMVPLFEKVFAPIQGLAVDRRFKINPVKGLPQGIGSDHDSFLAAGVPGFFWLQAGRANYFVTHHTQHDHFDKAIPEYQKHSAMVIAVGALGIANLDELLPRQGLVAQRTRRRLNLQYDEHMVLTEVVAGSATEKAGLKIGDKLLKINGREVKDIVSYRESLLGAPKETKVVVLRDGKEVELSVVFPE